MKLQLLILSLFSGLSLFSQDYYWVGNTGNWSDLSHWATTSGGNTFHTELPGPTNDVYLDENSFTEPGQFLYLDLEEADCHNFFAQDATNYPKVQGDYYLDDLNIYGDFILPNNVDRDLKTVELLGEDAGNILDLGTEPCGSLSFIRTASSGEYIQQSNMVVGNLYLYGENGTYNANGYSITCTSRFRTAWNNSTNVNLDGAAIYTNEFEMYESVNASMIDTWVFLSGQSGWTFKGGGKHYAYLQVDGDHVIEDDSSFDTFEVTPGSTVTFEAGSTQTADEFILNGTSDDPIYVVSDTEGQAANLVQSAGAVNATYLVMQDNHASGGADFNAILTIDNGNNDGWNIQGFVPQVYFWVGGSGDWSDVNHWATTSGGATNYQFPPSLLDNVIFDQNSFDSSSDIVTLTGERIVTNLDGTDALPGCKLETPNGNNSLTIIEDLNAGDMVMDLNELHFSGSTESNVSSYSGDFGDTNLRVENSTTLNVMSDLSLSSVYISGGDFLAANRTITTANSFETISNVDGTLDLTDADVYTFYWSVISSAGTYLLDGSTLHIESGMISGPGITYNDVEFTSDLSSISGNSTFHSISILPEAALTMTAGQEIWLDNFIANGTEDDLIEIQSTQDGVAAVINFTGGDIEVNYCDIRDNHAIGTGTYEAISSVNSGNTMGWTFDVIQGSDYYWVGGEGNWNDLSNWATSSGGTEFHTELPSLSSNIYFDENSFTNAGDAVTIEGEVTVDNIDASGALAGCAVQTSGSSDVLNVRGNLTAADLDFYINLLMFNGSLTSSLTTNSGDFTGTDLWVEDNTDFILNDDIQLNRIRIFGGNFLANGVSIVLEEDMMITNTGGQTVDLIGSDLEAKEWRITSVGGTYEMDLSALNISDEIAASNGIEYNSVTITGAACLMGGSSSYNVLEINPDANLSLENGVEIEVGLLIANGSEGELISIDCIENGGTGTFLFDNDQTITYVAIKDNHAEGVGTFTAVNSEDNGNTDGWFFEFIDHVEEAATFQTSFGPNPATTSISFSELPVDAHLNLYDNAGRLVRTESLVNSATMDISALIEGNYILIISSSEGIYTSKLVVQ